MIASPNRLHAGLCLDIATAVDEAAVFLLEPLVPPVSYKSEAAIGRWMAEAEADQQRSAATHMLYARVTGIAWADASDPAGETVVHVCPTLVDEAFALRALSEVLQRANVGPLVSWAGANFVWPILAFRSRVHEIPVGTLYRSKRYQGPHVDLSDLVHEYGLIPKRPLEDYVRRFGWETDLPPHLAGVDEGRVLVSGDWAALGHSLAHDVEAIRRMAMFYELIAPLGATDAPDQGGFY
jgi:hypothetical protein